VALIEYGRRLKRTTNPHGNKDELSAVGCGGHSYPRRVIDLHVATVLLQWATGGLAFLWVTTRRREVSLGYGWLLRATYAIIAAGGVASGFIGEVHWPRELLGIACIIAALVALAVSVVRRSAGVAGQRDVVERRSQRVAEMTGIDRAEQRFDRSTAEFPPALDLIAPAFGLAAIIAGALHADGPTWLSLLRVIVGAAFLGAITDGMLLGHWYLTQPGLKRAPLLELVNINLVLWPIETAVLLLPTGMISLLNGTIDDKYGGLLGWFWLASTIATIVMLIMTRLALRERQYAAVMAATGLLYLAILMAFAQDLVARILLDI